MENYLKYYLNNANINDIKFKNEFLENLIKIIINDNYKFKMEFNIHFFFIL